MLSTALILILIFSVSGILDTGYLVYHKTHKTDVACIFFPQEWCKKVQYSKQSKTFGIPNSYAGLFMYTTILILSILYYYGYVPFTPIQIIIYIGFAFSIYFIYVQAFKIKAFCTWCVLSAINFVILFISTFYISS